MKTRDKFDNSLIRKLYKVVLMEVSFDFPSRRTSLIAKLLFIHAKELNFHLLSTSESTTTEILSIGSSLSVIKL